MCLPSTNRLLLRLELWTLSPSVQGFFGFQRASFEDFQNATRLAMLASIAQHGVYLAKYGGDGNANFQSMQWRGLGNIGLMFPEFVEAESWYSAAVKVMMKINHFLLARFFVSASAGACTRFCSDDRH